MELLRQNSHGKGKIETTGSRNGQDKRRKEITEYATGGKGVLRPIPGALPISMKGPIKDTAQTKKKETKDGPRDGGSSSPRDASRPKPNTSPSIYSPPSTNVIAGPNATTIHVVNVPPIDRQKATKSTQETPSTATRTKNQSIRKKKRLKSPKKLPVTATSKAL
ncbi:unnamed protein product [Linum trigynum]|uniref:Uncharacterized protein n=1 Tax=Linum trigynum TaxID=586398 RepID=A0AAV2DBH9_9ROSI